MSTDLGNPRELPPDEVARLEARLEADPDDLEAREALTGHYARRSAREGGEGPATERLREHTRWLVENRPGSPAARLTVHLGDPRSPLEQAERAQLWLRQAEAHPEDAEILENAARYLTHLDPKRALQLFERARALVPERLELTAQIAQLRSRPFRRGDPDTLRSEARATLRDIEQHLPLAPDGQAHKVPPQLIGPITRAAFDAEEYDRAEHGARGMLDLAKHAAGTWNEGNLHFHGHTYLGRIALRRGDIAGALEHLRASAEIAGSPQLDSFGPNMSLAKELLEHGEVDAVVAFFERCHQFWKQDKVLEWIAIARAGMVPQFGANLVYGAC